MFKFLQYMFFDFILHGHLQLRQWIKNDLTLEHMKEDLYSLRWLSATDFQVPEALKLLKAHLVWRRENGIDSSLEENWQEMNARFPYDISGFDKAGRPGTF